MGHVLLMCEDQIKLLVTGENKVSHKYRKNMQEAILIFFNEIIHLKRLINSFNHMFVFLSVSTSNQDIFKPKA